ncbi:protocadherin beta-7-like [Pomacea canaliculata]|uniref:protocadherin beta-7-like n=1 Tax=Pomacea canaliculata TaxID=400727 RepID=UPI000D73536B|nr:protocadherin beta-7-like [Pomacea canaliculata]
MVVAIDNDFGAQIKYSILNSSLPFNIGSDRQTTSQTFDFGCSGVITLSGFLDYETKSQYFFIVSASDGVKVPREKGALVTTLQAEDKDANTRLSFALQNYKGLFSINDFGVIQVAAEPGNLTDNFYNLLVEVSDNGRPPRSSFAVVMVDFSPTFLESSSLPPEVATSEFKSVTIAMVVVAAILLLTIAILIVFICKR